jgi:putative DNA primase/helicase
MTEDYSIHKGAMWIGERRSGKGTLAWVQRQLVGEAYYAGLSFNTWVKGENSSQPLIGKKVLCFPDVRLRPPKWYGQSRDRGGLDHVSQELLLNITGGDPVTVGRKWIEAWGGQLRGKVILISNHPPDLGDGILPTRFVKVRVGQCFEDRLDLGLQGKLRPELPGIAVRCLAAYRRLKAREGFIQPKSATWLEEDVAANSNPYAEFVARHLVREDGAEVLCANVRIRFETWCQESGQLDVLRSTPKNLLTGRLREQGGLVGLRSFRPHCEPRRYLGIRLRTAREMYDFREEAEGSAEG